MKTLLKSLKSIEITTKIKKDELSKLEEITFLAENDLSPNEIEKFLGIKLTEYNQEYFNRNFKKYSTLLTHLNTLELIAYISFDQKLKKDLISEMAKKVIYPIILVVFAFITLVTFKFSILPLFANFSDKSSVLFINIFYYISITLFALLFLFSILLIYIFKNPTYFIIIYYRFYKFKIFKVIENYYISVFCHLLISFDNQGLSTFQTFKLINKFKGNTIIANLAYFVNADLEEGSGFEKSIANMQINNNFKNVVLMGMQTNKYNQLLNQFRQKTIKDIYKEINYLSQGLLLISYFYIGIIVLLLYKILSLPMALIDYI